MAAGPGAVQRNAGGEDGAQFSYNAGISACGHGGGWQKALLLLSDMGEARLQPDGISFNAAMTACGRDGAWTQALSLLGELRGAGVEPDIISPRLQRGDQRVRKG
ncbi:unnamed protein product [Prorocentrum cordatum]|uniref:Uncharacterized protein n=1 Tax=Prorocentrum cordatum TaxID=2364126 RepID=A0ABN9TGW8_9DINO|nr:unnamed protein product [Polarella glacialis]